MNAIDQRSLRSMSGETLGMTVSMFDLQKKMRLDGLVALVTGGAQGIGRATALSLAAGGARIVITDLDAGVSARVVAEIEAAGGSAWAGASDVANEDSVESLFAEIAKREGRIDILVNNAGVAIRRAAVELALADWEKVVAVNMTAVFLCSRSAARQMIAGGRGGAIVNVASIMGLSGGGLYPNISYQTTKGAVVNMTRALAVEWAPHQIRVNAVAPTYVRTQMTAPLFENSTIVEKIEAMTPLKRLAEPEDVAAAIAFLASPAAAMITGHTLPVDGGFLAQ
jgi:NAD(P)-dependent dehydrogenase (short-subunit alcohol dehydrogenase family)